MRPFMFSGLVVAALALSACSGMQNAYTAITQYAADYTESRAPRAELAVPADMFPEMTDKRSYAAEIVRYYLSARPDLVRQDKALFLEVLSYFEWYVHDVQDAVNVAHFRRAKMIEARTALRGELGIPPERDPAEVIAALRDMAQEMRAAQAPSTDNDRNAS